VLGALFRGKVLAALEAEHQSGRLSVPDQQRGRCWRRTLDSLYRKSWVIYAKRPFGGPAQVYRYLGRYTHRVAISNARLTNADERAVCFRTRGDHTETIEPLDFLRRFLEHVLPPGFVKIRHYGLLASGRASERREQARQILDIENRPANEPSPPQPECALLDLDWAQLLRELTGQDILCCASCGVRAVVRVPLPSQLAGAARGPPMELTA
jgi:hypothetical protein